MDEENPNHISYETENSFLKVLYIRLFGYPFQLLIHFFLKLIQLFIPKRKKSLKNEIVLITGAASGIGKLMAYKFAAQGAKLIVCWDINEKANKETVDNLLTEGYNAIGFKCDLSRKEDVYLVAENTKNLVKLFLKDEKAFVSILVNNAGVVPCGGKSLLECSDDLIELTMKVNCLSHFWTIKSFLPEMLKNSRGHITTISSVAGLAGNPGLVDYCSSKYATVGLTESLFMEIKKKQSKVKCTLICPFLINTGMFEGMRNYFSWVIPTLDPAEVADRVILAVRRDEYLVIMPRILVLVYYLKPILGINMLYRIGKILKIHTAMDNFIGRKEKV